MSYLDELIKQRNLIESIQSFKSMKPTTKDKGTGYISNNAIDESSKDLGGGWHGTGKGQGGDIPSKREIAKIHRNNELRKKKQESDPVWIEGRYKELRKKMRECQKAFEIAKDDLLQFTSMHPDWMKTFGKAVATPKAKIEAPKNKIASTDFEGPEAYK